MLGLDQPPYIQYVTWLVGNDWQKLIDMDGDGVAETPGPRKGVLRGDWGNRSSRADPVLEMIGDRLPNTLMLMVTAEVIIIIFSLLIGVYSALRKQYSFSTTSSQPSPLSGIPCRSSGWR
jgi:peptide/nickel transport system permease protein